MRRFVMLAVLSTLVVGPVLAQETAKAPRLEELLPPDTFFLASLNDVPAMRAQGARTALGKLFDEPEVREFLAPLLEMARAGLSEAEARLGHPVREILDALAGQAAVAVVSFDPLYGGPIPDVAIRVDLGTGRAAVEKIQEDLVARRGEKVGRFTKEHQGVSFEVLALPSGVELSLAYFGDTLVLTSLPERMRDMIERLQAGPAGSLAESPTFRAVSRNTGRDAFLSAFLNSEAILAHFGDRLPPMASEILDRLALGDVKGLGFGSTFAGEGLRETFFAYVPGEKRGLVKLFYASPGDGTGLFRKVPKSAFWAESGRVNFGNLYDEVLALLGDVAPAVHDSVQQQIYQAEEFLGFRIREDLLAPLGDEIAAYAAMPEGGGLIPDVVLLVRVKDPERFTSTLGQIVTRVQAVLAQGGRHSLSLRTLECAGRTIRYLHVVPNRGDPVPVTPAFVLEGDLAYFALVPQVLKDLAARDFRGPSILERPDFARVRKGLPGGMSSLEYLDFSQLVRIGYGTLVPVLQAAAKGRDVPVDMALLPRTETVARHFFGGAWGMELKDEGVAMHAYTPCGILPLMALTVAPTLWLSSSGEVVMEREIGGPPAPGLGDGSIGIGGAPKVRKESAPKPPAGSAAGRLEAVYVALLWHYAEKGSYPTDLASLVRTKALENPGALVLPGETAVAAGGVKTSLAYLGPEVGDLAEGRDRAVWVHSRSPVDGKRWVLFANGDRRQIAEADFARLLADTKARLAK